MSYNYQHVQSRTNRSHGSSQSLRLFKRAWPPHKDHARSQRLQMCVQMIRSITVKDTIVKLHMFTRRGTNAIE